ncbi:MAG: hypothetical protein AB7T59_02835 [Hyphomonadaceae bacterium]
MPEVRMSVGKALIGREELAPNFEVRADGASGGALIGEVTVSTGGVRWRAARTQSAHFLDWERFAALMEQQPRE